MNAAAINAFLELEPEIKQEFFEDVQSCVDDINHCVEVLESDASDEVINRMFRGLHTVKGNCRMVFLDDFVDTSHKIEDLFADVRSGKLAYDPAVGRLAVVAVNRMHKLLASLIANGDFDRNELEQLAAVVDSVRRAGNDDAPHMAERARIAIIDGHFNPELVAIDESAGQAFSFPEATDLEFFRFLLNTRINVSEEEKFIFETAYSLARNINPLLKQQVDAQQLEAAIICLVLSINWSRKQNEPVTGLALEQIYFAAGLLQRMSGWDQAAEIVLQALEQCNGEGIPNGLKDAEIHPAAQMLNLAFHFAQTALNNKPLGYKGALFAAVKSVNQLAETHYRSRLIERFNRVIKEHYLNQPQW